MSNRLTKSTENEYLHFPKCKSYAITEIMAAGGATAFANKIGKKSENISKHLRELPKDSFLTDEEAKQALKLLDKDK